MQFAKIVGQQSVKERLIQTVNDNRISHAQLFLGPEGSGNLSMALAYAMFINCTGRTLDSTDSCGTCPSCKKYNIIAHPDLHFVYPVAITKDVQKKPVSKDFITKWRSLISQRNAYITLQHWYDTIGIENRQGIINAEDCNEIIRTLSYTSYEARYKVMVIWMVEKLFHAAAPKLLKILEEPPDKTLFILVAEEPGQIISTILSRTQLVKIRKPADEEIRSALIANYGFDPPKAHSATLAAGGNFIEALDFTAGINPDEYFETFKHWMRLCYKFEAPETNKWIADMIKTGREKQKAFLASGQAILRECLAYKYMGQSALRREGDEAAFIVNISKIMSDRFIPEANKLLNEAAYHIGRNANPNILFMDLSLKLFQLLRKPAG
jgi:DNA polymerase III subunit delta'